ncbi:MAG: hypothetical protein HY326_06205 [Chloroflexi bacterium]|nr:hypothetical protein [Chloroflexota bacterium]
MEIPLLFGPYGGAALDYAARLPEYGANAVWFHGFSPEAFAACARHQLAPCVEYKTFRADFKAHPELIPIGVDSKPIRFGDKVQGICLSQQASLEEIEEGLVAGVQLFQPTGIWLDYLTYAGWFETPEPDLQESCFCAACIADFCQATGVDATAPAEILRRYAAQWTTHKCERIAKFTARYAGLIRAHLPNCVIGAYMCPWRPDEFEGALTRIFAQDYQRMAPAIDVFTPLIYVKKSGYTAAWGSQFLARAPEFVPPQHKVQLILDALDFPDSLVATAASPHPSWGLQLFGGAQVFADPDKARIFQEAVASIRRVIEN